MKRVTKQNKIVVGIIAIVLALTVGYALFSETLNINGTAKASGNFNLIFSEVLRNEVVQKGASIDVNDINITNESKTLSIGDTVFNFPSSYIEVAAMVENKGSIDAVLEGIKVTGLSNEFKLTLTGVKEKELFKSGEKKKVIVKIEWLEASTTTVPKTRFDIELVYNQAPNGYVPPISEEMTRDMFVWDSKTVVAGLSDKGIEHLRNNGGKLVIPEGVTEISSPNFDINTDVGTIDKGFSSFAIGKLSMDASEEEAAENSIITSVEFPSTLKKIGNYAFLGNFNLTSLTLPEGLEEIGEYAFASSFNIAIELVIPNSVTKLSKCSFMGSGITSLKLGSGLKVIEDSVFTANANLNGEIFIPDNVETIGEYIFDNTYITSVSISKNTSYETNSFGNDITLTIIRQLHKNFT